MSEIYIEKPYEGAMAKCDQCGELWAWDDQEVIHSVQDRLTAGCEIPSGECPDDNCRALCFLVNFLDVLPHPDKIGAAEYREIHELIASRTRGVLPQDRFGLALSICQSFEAHASWIAAELQGAQT
jgi:hypothetical protein